MINLKKNEWKQSHQTVTCLKPTIYGAYDFRDDGIKLQTPQEARGEKNALLTQKPKAKRRQLSSSPMSSNHLSKRVDMCRDHLGSTARARTLKKQNKKTTCAAQAKGKIFS